MARMIPPHIGKTSSNGERKVFEGCRHLNDDYVVLHSLGIVNHRRKVVGEIDFVIICSEGLLCVEVKGGGVRREDGIWYFEDRYGQSHTRKEGPFNQVISAMQSLRQDLLRRLPHDSPVSHCQFAAGVILPDVRFTQTGVDILPAILFDARNDFCKIEEFVQSVFRFWRNRMIEKHGFEGGRLSAEQIRVAADCLRGDFGFAPSLGDILRGMEDRMVALTEEQMELLEESEEDPRLIIKGGAGTGKTLLALEYAKRRMQEGKKVLFLCFSEMLAEYLRYFHSVRNSADGSLLEVNNFHGFLRKELKLRGVNITGDDAEFYQNVMPMKFCDMLGKTEFEKYDVVVIDEGQDLLRDIYLLCIDEILEDGISNGNWVIAFDHQQNIFNRSDFESGLAFLKKGFPSHRNLSRNCRNTKPIGVHATLCTGTLPTKKFLLDGEEVIFQSYKSLEEERRQVVTLIKKLRANGINPGTIVILSHTKLENSCLQNANFLASVCPFQDITKVSPEKWKNDAVKYCTVQSYKGLESNVVILIDVDLFSRNDARIKNYTGMTRAKFLLAIFYSEDANNELQEMRVKSLELLKEIRD